MTVPTRPRLLALLLRVAGCFTLAAFPAMLLPTDWMAATHAWLGLGEFPREPIVLYLARSIAALYGFHGALLLLVARDPVRHRDIVRYVGLMNVAFGILLLIIDLQLRMPFWWILGEGPPIVAFGLVVLLLNRPSTHPSGQRV